MEHEYEYRAYQEETENTLLKDLLSNNGTHPVAAIPTGGGKTKILSSLIYKYLEIEPTHNVLVLSHTETIIQQNYDGIKSFFPGIYIGLYSSGLGSKSIEKITVAGIQSVYKKHKLFKNFNLVIVDECHSVPTKGSGMYRKFFESIDCIRLGLSGSPFRAGHGYVHTGEGALFNKLSVDLCTMDNFNKLVDDGYLTQLYSKPPSLQLDTKGIKESAGDYNLKHLSERFDRSLITSAAVDELVKFGRNYSSWLIFAIDIDHADNINKELLNKGIKSVSLHSRSDNDRHEIKRLFVKKEIRAIVSVGMITTGFDAPNIDLLVLLRPTTSPVLHVQMIGRGLRICEGKTHCLVLDFAGNISRLGPINNIIVKEKGESKKGGTREIVKTCPNCGCLHHPTVKICNVCQHEFEFAQKLSDTFSTDEVVQKSTKKEWLDVTKVIYLIHKKLGSPDSLKVVYFCGLYSIAEYVCYDHNGYAKYKANNWVTHRWQIKELPTSVENLHKYSKFLKSPNAILVDLHEKYPVILDVKFF